ncbi:hypothetical protein UCDDS831_g05267 [Diplodia seriata]|uniref:Uncharacterized protein n=1 Tax=Diplodia seriata TaxID=420778 RepID=A0A0G2G7A9_9PEZI|nr:hypothetical protein UCDDS831_g05267 [Diplodia seriata]
MASNDPYRAGHGTQHFVPPPQAYTAPPPVNNQQQLSRYYQDAGAGGNNANTSLAPWTAPPAGPVRGDSYRSQRSQRSQRSHRSRRSVRLDEDEKHREKRPTMGDSLFAFWGVMWGAVRSPSGKRS